MRISDWSSDVCSSDLGSGNVLSFRGSTDRTSAIESVRILTSSALWQPRVSYWVWDSLDEIRRHRQIGRASCRARVCQSVSISVVAVSLKNKRVQRSERTNWTLRVMINEGKKAY